MDKGKSLSTPAQDASNASDLPPTVADLLGGSSITTTKIEWQF